VSIKFFLKLLISVCVSVLVGTVAFLFTASGLATVTGGVVSGILGFISADSLLYWQQYSRHSQLYKELELRLSPPQLCPAILDDVEEAILHTIRTEQIQVEDLTVGTNMPWKRYGELLESSLRYSKHKFLATCFLTPTQLMDERFKPYMGVQRRRPNMCLSSLFFRKRRLRVMAVEKRIILEEYADAEKRRIMEQFFAWHRDEKVPVYFISKQEFKDLHTNQFSKIELNDFVCFGDDDYKWVVGGSVGYEEEKTVLEGMPFVKLIDSSDASVREYRSFVKMLLISTRPTKTLKQLIKWCGT